MSNNRYNTPDSAIDTIVYGDLLYDDKSKITCADPIIGYFFATGIINQFFAMKPPKNSSEQTINELLFLERVTANANEQEIQFATNAEISEKASKNAYKGYDYIFPSGRTERMQGFENYMLNDLLFKENISENDIIVKRSGVPIIWYLDANGKKHRYFVDCFIKSQNRCIEVKSTWTAEKKQDIIYLKQQALKDAGYLCEIWIYDSKGEIVEKIY